MTDQRSNNEMPAADNGDATILGPSAAPKLQMLRGATPGKTFQLKFKTRAGREIDNDITIVDPRISRYHFQISLEEGKWVLSDLGSVNGTQINGLMVSVPQTLTHGDQITVGETVMVFRDPTVEASQAFDPADTVHGRRSAAPVSSPLATNNRSLIWIVFGLILILILALAGLYFWLNRTQATTLIEPLATATQSFTILRTTPKPEQNLSLKYDETFDDSFGGWDDAFGKYFTKQYGNNRYHIEITTNNLVVWGLANRVAADFELEVEAKHEAGANDNTYGLIFRYVDSANYYRFDLSGDGFYLLSKFEDGLWSTLADWAQTTAIHQGAGVINVIKISASGPEIVISANGEELLRVVDDTFASGNFGFFASTFESPHMWVSFDSLKLWAPPDQEIALIPSPESVQTKPVEAIIGQAATPTLEPTATLTQQPTETPTPTEIPTATSTPEADVSTTKNTPTPSATATFVPTATATETPTVELTATVQPSATVAPEQLPGFVSRDQPLARGQAALSGKLYFPVYDPNRGTYDIFRAEPNGSNQELVQLDASQPALNSAGTHLAFRSWKSDERGLYTRPVDATDKWRFVQFFEAASPTFSTDNQFFIFHSRQGGGPPALYRTFGTAHEVLRRDGIPIQGEMISLTPDSRIVYRGCTGNTCGLIISNLDGTFPQQLTAHADDTAPRISPDGQTIAFMTNRDGNWEVYTISVDGQNLQRLTNEAGNDGLPTWSPDGAYLAFATNRDGAWAIWVMQPNGNQARQLFILPGSIDGVVQVDIQHAFGWVEERIVWTP